MSMHVNGDFYNDQEDVESIIHALTELKEEIEASYDVSAIDDAVEALYEIIENAE